ncbi:MAG TPA: MvaI/BcnI family restriction endonuclease [Brevefilum sp.]|nr:MvaI/BcnI family restriction endonuclease [Brevefilum sp.]HOR18875.1 MvaI/BcnI family restriction endonuclease [Brevefilum sp.]HPL69661.1 MvaI/BcnI family restriction endonuclease [Brevefilum sp.]
MKIYSKETLIEELVNIRNMGWIPNARWGNVGGIGNTLEDLLGIEENNLPIPNAAEWELKCQRAKSTALMTLFHMEPSPRVFKFVPQVLLPNYGWEHQEAGKKHSKDEMSFRQTISGHQRSDRGFSIKVDREKRKISVSFDSNSVDGRHGDWLKSVGDRIGFGELNPQPYWGFDDLRNKAGTKLLNCFFIRAETKKIKNQEYFYYSTIMVLEEFDVDGLITGLEQGFVYVDFDARTGHNHGTKFRLQQNKLPLLYKSIIEI